jgi:COP9 signalosome complex subunit 3
MDEILPKLLAFPPQPQPQSPLPDAAYDKAIKQHISALGKIPEKVLIQPTSSGEHALDVSIMFCY